MNAQERRSMVDWFAQTICDKITEPRMFDKQCFTTQSFHDLFNLMMDEANELVEASGNPDAMIAEAVDVAAYACFIAYNALQRRLRFLEAASHIARIKNESGK